MIDVNRQGTKNKIYNIRAEKNVNIYVCILFIISLFSFLREFTRVKWSENENEYRER